MVYREPVYFFLLEALFLQLLAFEEHAITNQNLGLVKLKCNLHIRNIQVTCIHNMYIHKVLGLLKCCFPLANENLNIIWGQNPSFWLLHIPTIFFSPSISFQTPQNSSKSCPNLSYLVQTVGSHDHPQ